MYIDRDTIIQTCATLFVVAVIIFGLALALRIWQNRPRKPVPPLTVRLTADTSELCAAFEALDRVVATLEQDAAYRQEQALGNEVVRLNECRAVVEAEQVLEQYQARLESEKDR